MGKSKKRNKSPDEPHAGAKSPAAVEKNDDNPLLTAQQRFLNSLSPQTIRSHFFSPTHVTPERRGEIWEEQADLGETLVNSYAWATPDPRLLRVFQHFGPIVEVGCGANAYWSKWMNSRGGWMSLRSTRVWRGVVNSPRISERTRSRRRSKPVMA